MHVDFGIWMIDKMSTVFLSLGFLFVNVFLSVSSERQCRNERPNVIIMLMDDMGWGDLGANGNPVRETPNLDRMAEEGMLFTDFYAGNPLCSPSRASLLTGRLTIRNGFYTTNEKARNGYVPQEVSGGISKNEILISEVLKEAGYRNKIIGKWHLGHSQDFHWPWNRGFHYFSGSFGVHFKGMPNLKPEVPVYRDNQMIGRYYEEVPIVDQQSDFLTNMTDEAIEFIRKESSDGNPFFLYWTPDSLHCPTYRSAAFVGRSARNYSYGDTLMEIDYSVGRIMDSIRNDRCLANNTFVFFTSDNGPALFTFYDAGTAGPLLCGKQTTFEGGVREPAIAWWPSRIPAATKTNQIGTVMDLFRTVVSITGANMPTDRIYDSNDLTEVMFHRHENPNATMFYYRGDTLMAIRNGPYKAHYWTQIGPDYDFCPGQRITGFTTMNLTDHRQSPILFHLLRDLSERFPIHNLSQEYKTIIPVLEAIRNEHVQTLVPGEPQLNWCDSAAMSWSPPGCQTNREKWCLPVPKSDPKLCVWTH